MLHSENFLKVCIAHTKDLGASSVQLNILHHPIKYFIFDYVLQEPGRDHCVVTAQSIFQYLLAGTYKCKGRCQQNMGLFLLITNDDRLEFVCDWLLEDEL
jgi:hypothetical protein